MAPLVKSMSVDETLKKCGAVLYDLEIIAAVPMSHEPRDNRLAYCGGWDDHAGMGISVLSAYDFVEEAYRIYLADNMSEWQNLVNSRNIIIGFNNKRFDDKVCLAAGLEIPPQKSWDIWKAIVDTQPPGQRKGFSLDPLLKANGLEAKSGLGANAPMQAQLGLWGALINYNLDDTRKEVQILRLLIAGLLKSPINGEYIKTKMPWEDIKVDMGGLF